MEFLAPKHMGATFGMGRAPILQRCKIHPGQVRQVSESCSVSIYDRPECQTEVQGK